MSVATRHDEILRMLKRSEKPLSGSLLSESLGVSRQIIVQDMNTLKANGQPIISTARGYILDPYRMVTRVYKVRHTVPETADELNMIVDLGGEVNDVFIYHKVYGEIHAKLNITSRRDVKDFMADIESGKSSPLMTVTSGYHYHTVAAKDFETLDLIEKELQARGYWAELTDYEPSILLSNEE